MNSSYLPSKKVWILLSVILVITVGFFVLRGDENNPSIVSQINARISGNDIEGSGFLGFGSDSRDTERAEFSSNKTTEAWQDLFPYMASYVSVSGDKEIAEGELDRLTEEVAQKIQDEEVELYTESDVQIISNASFDDLDTYFEDMVTFTAEYYTNTSMEDELLIFAQASADNEATEDELKELRVIADQYKALASELIQLPVPASLALIHLEMVNNYVGLGNATRNMSTLQTDPVRSMVGLENYQQLANEQIIISEELGRQIGRQARLLAESE
ncbi:MAG: hypothetical protein WD335_00285 [Candidatus Paceibacterota bacterium]